ncbi:hypothetical protein S4054249_17620 [Pseudoalteromonas luteoviolacea]|uniref:Uncharacterized protein n=2 Tax=Pseudoalteromonas luteoviolacea TaxID=43657 RepID=A0A0F6AAG9_9GAMM|nr:hypothetical protein S4054249_17620 [Pseudoalteromonas luteoviolacea]AOT14446.1 hypothetical protein S40542_17590 [Pseudoalteromonas luteoviolacea]AOT19362.1 hypothetical protein S4054_17595 [Pseudoalteromonas luteoviolacea]KKE83207.1 hypothetical protein N479_15295 [Pseudoalteromonas luteoviolacea S4054]KZN68836.1 hypothetical protein N481_23105 [Pseudoalteromonas luteoviolacea S4047-1]
MVAPMFLLTGCLQLGHAVTGGIYSILPEQEYTDQVCLRLARAALNGNLKRLNTLLATPNHQVNCQGETGFTPLYFAIKGRQLDTYTRLLEAGADPNIPYGERGDNVTFLASWIGIEYLRPAAEHGADFNKRNALGRTPVYKIISSDTNEAFLLALSKGFDVNNVDNSGGTPIVRALGSYRFFMAWKLLENGADINLNPLSNVGDACFQLNRAIERKHELTHSAQLEIEKYYQRLADAAKCNDD